MQNTFASDLKLSKEKDKKEEKRPSHSDMVQVYTKCIDPLSKAVTSMKSCKEDLEDADLKDMLCDCVESVAEVQKVLLERAGSAITAEVAELRGPVSDSKEAPITVDMIAGRAPLN